MKITLKSLSNIRFMSKETFNEALRRNLPPLIEWETTQIELNKLWDNLNKYFSIKDLLKLPQTVLEKFILNNNLKENLLNNPNTDIFFNKNIQYGGNPFNYIYDINNKRYYHIHSKKGEKLISKYSKLVGIYKF